MAALIGVAALIGSVILAALATVLAARLRDLSPTPSWKTTRGRLGYGLDLSAATDSSPFPVTADPGMEEALYLDGLAWSAAGCPMPPGPVPARECAYGHPVTMLGGHRLAIPVRSLLGRQVWVCQQGHPAAVPVSATVTDGGVR